MKNDTFPTKLFKMLSNADWNHYDPNHEAISWLPDGKSFKIHSERKFTEQVMHQYFVQPNLKSFIRQLYLYGFLKTVSGVDYSVFHHPSFMRSDPHGSMSLKRNQSTIDRRRSKPAMYIGCLKKKKNCARNGVTPRFTIMETNEETHKEVRYDSSTSPLPFPSVVSDTMISSIVTPRHLSATLGNQPTAQLTDIIDDVLSTVDDYESEFMEPISIPQIILENRADESHSFRVEESQQCTSQGICMDVWLEDVLLLTPRPIEEMIRKPRWG